MTLGPIESIAIPPRGEGPVIRHDRLRMATPAPAGAVPTEAGTITVSAEVGIAGRRCDPKCLFRSLFVVLTWREPLWLIAGGDR